MKYILSILFVSLFLYCISILGAPNEDKKEYVYMLAPGEHVEEVDSATYDYVYDYEWYGLFSDDERNLYLKRSDVSVGTSYNDCTEEMLTSVDGAGIVLLTGYQIKEKQLSALSLPSECFSVKIGETFKFNFQGIEYQLRAEGKMKEDLGWQSLDNEYWDCVAHYELYLSNGETEQLLFTQEEFLDTSPEIIFLGDMDEDGKIDLLISNPRDYEMVSKLLFLSSYAEEENIVELVANSGYDFSC